jgi:hypothetical protein
MVAWQEYLRLIAGKGCRRRSGMAANLAASALSTQEVNSE